MKKNKNKGGKIKDPTQRAIAQMYGNESVNAAGALTGLLMPKGALGEVDTNVPGAESITQDYQGLQNKYANRDDTQNEVMAGLKSGLGGYTSPEYQAQREQMMRGMNSNFATGLGQLAKSQARGKVYGAAASAQQANAITGQQQSKDNLEQDLMVKNIDEKQRRLTEYGKYGQDLTQSEFDRQSGALNDSTTAKMKLGDRNLDRQKINMGNRQAELGSQMNLYLGTLGQGYSKGENRAARKLQKRAIDKISG